MGFIPRGLSYLVNWHFIRIPHPVAAGLVIPGRVNYFITLVNESYLIRFVCFFSVGLHGKI